MGQIRIAKSPWPCALLSVGESPRTHALHSLFLRYRYLSALSDYITSGSARMHSGLGTCTKKLPLMVFCGGECDRSSLSYGRFVAKVVSCCADDLRRRYSSRIFRRAITCPDPPSAQQEAAWTRFLRRFHFRRLSRRSLCA